MNSPAAKPRGLPKVRREPPTLDEAIYAAQGLTSDMKGQVEIAAGLMGVPEEEVRAHLSRIMPRRATSIVAGRRNVIVEHRRVHARA